MSGYRFYDAAPVFMGLDGLDPVAGGSLSFYDAGTTNPRNTWSDADLTIANTNPVQLDSSGRANTNIWLSGAYSVTLKDAAGATIWTRDVNDGAQGGLVIPTNLVSGQVLSNDGAALRWDDFRQVPDPTGSVGKVLGALVGGLGWVSLPDAPALPITVTATSIKIMNILIQWGSGSLPATGFRSSSVSVGFGTAFTAAPYFVGVTPTNKAHTAEGQIGVPAVVSKSPTGFSVHADTDDAGRTGASFIGPETFDWFAIGPTTA